MSILDNLLNGENFGKTSLKHMYQKNLPQL